MIIDLNEYTSLLVKTKLTPMQLYICFLLSEKSVENIAKYVDNLGFFSKDDLSFLEKEDYIITTKKGHYDFLDLFVTPKFTSLVTMNEDEQGEEFWKLYPSWILIENRKVPSKATDKAKLIKDYFKEIKGSLSEHAKVIRRLKILNEQKQGYATMKITSFVSSRHWENLTEEQSGAEFEEI